jgi:hypothetical protein
MNMTRSPEKIEKNEKKTHAAMKSVGVISLAAFIIMIGIFSTAVNITTTSQAYAQTYDRRAVSEIIDVSGITNSGCENGGETELIEFSGDAHVVSQIVQDETGVHIVQHVNFQGVRGEGLTTGTNYRVPYGFNSIAKFVFDVDGAPASLTEITSFHFVSQGKSAQDVVVNVQFHVTLNANGELTTEINNFRVECR